VDRWIKENMAYTHTLMEYYPTFKRIDRNSDTGYNMEGLQGHFSK
jgi:hypothetical protein